MPDTTQPTADGFALYSKRHTTAHWWNLWAWIKGTWLSWFPGKFPESNLCSAEELAEKVLNSMARDHGRHWLLWMGVDHEKVKAMSDEEMMAVSREVASWPKKEPETCSECGQDR